MVRADCSNSVDQIGERRHRAQWGGRVHRLTARNVFFAATWNVVRRFRRIRHGSSHSRSVSSHCLPQRNAFAACNAARESENVLASRCLSLQIILASPRMRSFDDSWVEYSQAGVLGPPSGSRDMTFRAGPQFRWGVDPLERVARRFAPSSESDLVADPSPRR